jgi:16S rRNA (cytidine1402-2'-O)-methyltransferase
MPGVLYVVATPIGNLEDLSPRAARTLAEVALVVAEDTRRTRALLTHLGLSKKMASLPAFAEAGRVGGILERLAAGDDVALVTDGGTPMVSDPGAVLAAGAVAMGSRVVPIPGPSAVIAALSASGFPADRFHFLGFLPRKGGARRRLIALASELPHPIVLFESPNRIGDTLKELAEHLGPRRAVVARELTKLHETFERGTLSDLASRIDEVLGEVTLVISGRTDSGAVSSDQEDEVDEAEVEREVKRLVDAAQMSLRDVAGEVAKATGMPRREVYAIALRIAGKS